MDLILSMTLVVDSLVWLDINCQVTAWKIQYRLSPCSVLTTDTYLETHPSTLGIVLHLMSVIVHSSAIRFSELQGGINTLDDEYFSSLALCLIFFICMIISKFNATYHKSTLACLFPDECFGEAVRNFFIWLSLRAIESDFEAEF